MEQLVLWILVGVVIGARIIYCFVYDPKAMLANPFYLFQVYRGGLSFHGGMLGTVVAAIVFCRKKGVPFWNLADAMALATPTGLAMGRLGNFINGELYGRVSYVPWAVIFKDGGPEPRHPSQLYEAALEGLLLFAFMQWRFWRTDVARRHPGRLSGEFLVAYALVRIICEIYREPDVGLTLIFGLSRGTFYSLLLAAGGLAVVALSPRAESKGKS